MKVLHAPFVYYPDPVGGTEVYVGQLAQSLEAVGTNCVIAAPAEQDAVYTYAGLRVRRFVLPSQVSDVGELYGEGDANAAAAFGRILDDEQPDVLHLHALTRGVSLRLVREAHRRGVAVVFTYHTPTVSCQRGTLLRWGNEVCDGLLRLHVCAACTLDGQGVGRAARSVLSSLPPQLGHLAAVAHLSGGVWTGVRTTELLARRHSTVRALLAEVDHLIAVCGWAREVLIRNGAPANRVSVSRHGLPDAQPNGDKDPVTPPAHGPGLPMQFAFFGRLDPTKGADVLIRAVRSLPNLPLRLDMYGIVQGPSGEAFLSQLRALAGDDPRIRILPPVPAAEVVACLKRYHLLAVPSVWMETGPLVVLEAFAAGIPVLGSNLGGISELVTDGVDGVLVAPGSPNEWARALQKLVDSPNLLLDIQRGVRPPRRMADVADDMCALYTSLLRSPEHGCRQFQRAAASSPPFARI